jgi:hypothetical protein
MDFDANIKGQSMIIREVGEFNLSFCNCYFLLV